MFVDRRGNESRVFDTLDSQPRSANAVCIRQLHINKTRMPIAKSGTLCADACTHSSEGPLLWVQSLEASQNLCVDVI